MRINPPAANRQNEGIALIDCLIYIAVLAVVLGLAMAAFFRTLDHSTELNRTSQATVQALQLGEQWREDLRMAQTISSPAPDEDGGPGGIRLTSPKGDVAYAFREGSVWRRANAASPWVEALKEVKASRFSEDRRRVVRAWRWEVELASRQETSKFRRVLTFQAVPRPTP
jgi:hypothetical protein